MTTDNIELLAAYFTIAGDIYPLGPTEISPFPFRDRVEAAARAGYQGIGLHHADTMHTASQIGLPEMRRILDANGIKYVELEFLLNWFEEGERRRESDKMRSEIFSVAAALGLRKIKVGPGFHEPEADIPKMRDAFAQLCREAAEHGTGIMLEIMPWSNVRTVETARAIVGRWCRGIVEVRGESWPTSGILPVAASITMMSLRSRSNILLGLSSMMPLCRWSGSLWEDTIHHRRLCGEGDLNPPAFIEAVQAAGYRGYYGVEFSLRNIASCRSRRWRDVLLRRRWSNSRSSPPRAEQVAEAGTMDTGLQDKIVLITGAGQRHRSSDGTGFRSRGRTACAAGYRCRRFGRSEIRGGSHRCWCSCRGHGSVHWSRSVEGDRCPPAGLWWPTRYSGQQCRVGRHPDLRPTDGRGRGRQPYSSTS